MPPNSTKPTAKSSPTNGKSCRALALGAMLAALALAIGADAAQRSESSAADERRYVPDEVLVRLASDAPDGAVEALARRLRLDQVGSVTSDAAATLRWRIPDRRAVPAVIRALEAEPLVLAAQPNFLYRPQELDLSGRMQALDPATPADVARPEFPPQEATEAVGNDRR